MVFPSQWQARRARLLGSVALLLSLLATAPGCTRDASSSSGQDAKVNVVATVGFLGDVAREIGGDRVEVDSLMGPGVDPHLYKPTEQDIQRLTGADLILFVGLNLEGKMSDLFVKLARRGRHAFAVTEDLDTARLREPPELAGHYDPHIWFDVSLWQEAVRGTTRALTEVDPAGKDHYEARASAYLQRLEALHVSVKERIAQIPKERRVLVTSHDAFGYFGRAYDIDVIGLQGISTVNEAGLGDVKRIKDVIKRRGVKAVFVETSVSQKGMTAVIEGLAADGYPIKIGGKLYSDAMGAAGSPGGTYLGMIEENVKAIVGALK